MTILATGICVLCQLCLVTGHLLLKHAMNATHANPKPWTTIVWYVAGGTCLLSVWFFLWLGLLRTWDLSQIFPFEGLSPPLLVLGAWLFLDEHATPRTWLGIGLIGAGVGFLALP